MLAVQLIELGKPAVRSLVSRKRILFEPAIAAKAVEVFARIDRRIDQAGIEYAQLRGRGSRLRRGIVLRGVLGEQGSGSESGKEDRAAKQSGSVALHADTLSDSRVTPGRAKESVHSIEVVALDNPVHTALAELEAGLVFAMQGDGNGRAVHIALKEQFRRFRTAKGELALP